MADLDNLFLSGRRVLLSPPGKTPLEPGISLKLRSVQDSDLRKDAKKGPDSVDPADGGHMLVQAVEAGILDNQSKSQEQDEPLVLLDKQDEASTESDSAQTALTTETQNEKYSCSILDAKQEQENAFKTGEVAESFSPKNIPQKMEFGDGDTVEDKEKEKPESTPPTGDGAKEDGITTYMVAPLNLPPSPIGTDGLKNEDNATNKITEEKGSKLVAHYRKTHSMIKTPKEELRNAGQETLRDKLLEAEALNMTLRSRLKRASRTFDKLHDENWECSSQSEDTCVSMQYSDEKYMRDTQFGFLLHEHLLQEQHRTAELYSSLPLSLSVDHPVSLESISSELEEINSRLQSLENNSSIHVQRDTSEGSPTSSLFKEIPSHEIDDDTTSQDDRCDEVEKELEVLYRRMNDLEREIGSQSWAQPRVDTWSSRPESGRQPPKMETLHGSAMVATSTPAVPLLKIKSDKVVVHSEKLIKKETSRTEVSSKNSSGDENDTLPLKLPGTGQLTNVGSLFFETKLSSTSKRTPFEPREPKDIKMGYELKFIKTDGTFGQGCVKYIGCLPRRSDIYYGIELPERDGRHDGTYEGKRYFKCKGNHGAFVPFSKIIAAWKM